MRLIDADHAKHTYIQDMFDTEGDFERVNDVLDYAPTVGAVVVTRCKDCVHWDDDPDTYGTDDGPKGKCMKSFETMCADDFCSYGEPKESQNADDHD